MATDLSTLRDGQWFNQTTYIWNGNPLVVNGGYPDDSDDSASLFHDVLLRNIVGDAYEDTKTSLTIDKLYMNPGSHLTIEPSLSLSIRSLSVWSGGTIGTNSQGSFLQQLGITTVTGPTTLSRATIINTNQMVLANGTTLGMTAGSLITNSSAASPNPSVAVIDYQSDAGIVPATGGAGSAATIENFGIIRKSAGTGRSEVNVQLDHKGGAANNSAGTIEVLTGTLGLTGGSADSTGGHLQVANGAVLEFGGTVAHSLGQGLGPVPIYTASGLGHVRLVAGATIRGNEQGRSGVGASPRAIFNFDPGVFQWEGGTIEVGPIRNDGDLNLTAAGNMDLSGQIMNKGRMIHLGLGTLRLNDEALINDTGGLYDFQNDGGIGNIQNGLMTNRGTLRKSGGAGTSYVNRGVNNLGTVEALAGTLRIDNIDQITGTMLTGGTYKVGAGATLQIDDNSNIATNQASVVLSGVGSTFAKIAPLANNQGSFELNSGRNFTTVGNLTNSGLIKIGKPSVLTINGTYTQTATGQLKGSGKLVATKLKSAGKVSPGASPGLLEIEGDYEQDPEGILDIEIGGYAVGDDYDRLAVTGAAILAGTLHVDLFGGFQPHLGDTFDILTAANVTGQLVLDGPMYRGSPVFEARYDTPGMVSLRALQTVPEPTTFALLILGIIAAASNRSLRSKRADSLRLCRGGSAPTIKPNIGLSAVLLTKHPRLAPISALPHRKGRPINCGGSRPAMARSRLLRGPAPLRAVE